MKRPHYSLSVYVLILCGAAVPGVALAIDDEGATVPPVLISETRTEQPVESATGSVTVITAKQIHERQLATVAEALRHVAGVDVRSTGGPGAQSSVFIRGANSQHTLVMIDGVQVNHPSIGGFDFADLTTDNIERIEIVRGPQSTLYGSDAIGGVINIITKRGDGEPTASVMFEGGRYDTAREAASIGGQSGGIDVSASLSHLRTAGFSHAAGPGEPDGYLNTTVSTKLGMSALGDGRAELIARYAAAQRELDGFGPVDDPLAAARSQQLVVAASLQKPITTVWDQRFAVSVNTDRYMHNQFGEFSARGYRADWQHNVAAAEPLLLTIGSEYEGLMGQNSGDSNDHTMITYAVYAQAQVTLPQGWSLVTGVRRDANNRFGTAFTYKTSIAYLLAPTQTKVRASLGTGFRGPTFQDLFFPGFSNPTLTSESSQTVEAGIDQWLWENKVLVSVTHFRTLFDDLIALTFDPLECPPGNPFGCPINVGVARSVGQEVLLTIAPIDQVTVTSSYTHTTAKETATDTLLVRRPRSKASFGITIKPIPPLVLTADVDFVGRRLDAGGMLRSYWLARTTASYAVARGIQLFGRIENALDRDYQEISGFATAGLSLYAGVRGTFN
ncbi:MAG: TonB-dependent receptor [Nitrospirota bacterium]